jgi:SAM-dependent methyltransferase
LIDGLMPPERNEEPTPPSNPLPRPLTTTFAPPWLCGTTIKGSTEPFANLPPIAKLASEAALQELAGSRFGVSQPVAGYRLRDTAPIPSTVDREHYHAGDDTGYWLSGLSDALAVARQAARLGLNADSRYFELGCASGRVVRHVAFGSAAPISCCDINKRHTEWVRLFLPERINVFHNSVLPNLPIEDNSIDIATAFSVFTHIDDFEAAWLLELRRILRPDGLAYLTVATDHTWEQYKQRWIKEQLLPLAGRITEHAIDEAFFAGPLPREKTVIWWSAEQDLYNATVFHQAAYIRREWGRIFKVLDIVRNGHFYQDVVLLTK